MAFVVVAVRWRRKGVEDEYRLRNVRKDGHPVPTWDHFAVGLSRLVFRRMVRASVRVPIATGVRGVVEFQVKLCQVVSREVEGNDRACAWAKDYVSCVPAVYLRKGFVRLLPISCRAVWAIHFGQDGSHAIRASVRLPVQVRRISVWVFPVSDDDDSPRGIVFVN